ncbi:hypothetical protein [Clostridium sp. 2218st1_F5_2218SCRN_220325]|uniref:lipopolysaccharide biosynthesis protein n=1 Tax=Clostridium sp. 2218st1_F5_2218SCRN_220325 TaxID=3143056 RepID=UPI00319E0DF1
MEAKSRVEYSVLNIATGLGGYIVNTILGFICRMVFVRCLAADYLGISGLFTNIISMLSLAELGIGSAVVYALYKPLAENDEQKIASLVDFYGKAYRTIGIFIAVIGLILIPFLNVIIRDTPDIKESIYLLYFIYLFNTASTYFFSYKSSLIIAAQQNYIVGGLNYIITIIQSIVQMIYLIITREYIGYLLIQTIGTFIYNILISHIAVKKFPYIKEKEDIDPLRENERKSLFRNIKDLTVYKLSGLLVNSTDNIITTFFNGLATTGMASNYTLLTTTLNSLLNQIFNGLTASIGNYNVTETKERQYSMFKFLNMMNFWIFSWASIGILCVSNDLVKLCFGESYVLGIEIPFVIGLNFYTVGMQNAVWTFKQTLGLFKYGKYMQVFTALFNIIFSVLLGYKYGLFGILLATFIARLLTNLWYDPYIVYKHGFFKKPIEYFSKYFKYLIIMIINVVICAFLCKFISGNLVMSILIKCIICSFIPNIVYLILFFRNEEFKYLISLIRKVFEILKRNRIKINL